jgi:hypothetical protein
MGIVLSTIDGPAWTLYGPGAAGLLRRYTGRATSRSMDRATGPRYYKGRGEGMGPATEPSTGQNGPGDRAGQEMGPPGQ